MIVVDVLARRAELSASVPESGEAVEVDAVALAALVCLEQARQSHRLVVVHDGNRGHLGRSIVVAQLVIVYHEFLSAYALRQQMVGDELVQYVHLVGVVVVVERAFDVGEESRLAKEVADILRGNTCGMKGTSCADQLARAIDKNAG